MSAYDVILKRRTVRKFLQKKIDRAVLEKLVNAARYAPSASNLQPLKYIIVDDEKLVKAVFVNVKWAGYIAPEGNPGEGEKPVAFIIVLADLNIRSSGYELDIGAAVQNILLTAAEEGIGSCWMGAINRDNIRKILSIPEKFAINTAVALGYAGEEPVAEAENGSIKYYKDAEGVLHVPKRKLEDIII